MTKARVVIAVATPEDMIERYREGEDSGLDCKESF